MLKDVWLDFDTGSDDVFAIILAGNHEQINLIGISTVFGNTSVEKTTLNTLKITSMSGIRHIKVYKGASKAILRPLESLGGEKIHGEEGLGKGIYLPDPTYTHEEGPFLYNIFQAIKNNRNKVNICATGALTNIALLINAFPDVTMNIE